jgi:flagellin-like protein
MGILVYHTHQSQKGGIKENMKNFRRSRKALSPVVASIILIAVTVAVSIAVAAWMGALTVGFMGSNSVTVTNVSFTTAGSPAAPVMDVALKNTGTKSLTISQVKVNNFVATANTTISLDPAATGTLRITAVTGQTYVWTAGNPYKLDFYDTSGQVVASYQANAPGT